MRSIRQARVVVCGGAGFLGSHLVNHLIEDRNCRVLVLDNLCVGRREFIHPKAEFHYCDITKSESHLRNVFEEFGNPDVPEIAAKDFYVFNYAAWPYIPDSFVRPLHVFEVNATGAMNVINAAQEAGAAAILQVSSAEIYGDAGGIDREMTRQETQVACGINEYFEVRPHSTYGVAKAAVDYYCQTAWRERKTPVIALRQFNCVGERETHPYVVPEIISQVSECRYQHRMIDTAQVKLGNNSFRDFLYAGDAVRMACELLEKGSFGEVYNLGSEGGVQIYDLARRLAVVMGFQDCEVHVDPARVRPWEIWHLRSDNRKVHSVIEARPQVDLDEALRRTIDWYEQNGRRWPWEIR